MRRPVPIFKSSLILECVFMCYAVSVESGTPRAPQKQGIDRVGDVNSDSGPLSDDACDGAIEISGEGLFAFDNTEATIDGLPHADCASGLTNPPDDQVAHDVWRCWTSPCTDRVFIRTCNLTTIDSKLAVYEGCDVCPPVDAALLDCNDDFCGYDTPQGFPFQSLIIFDAVQGQTYLIRIGTFPGGGSFPDADGGPGAIDITCGPPEHHNCPGDGSCCEGHTTPGCASEDCCDTVCACDSYCCEVEWDEYCATLGFENTGCGAEILCASTCDLCQGSTHDCCEGAATSSGIAGCNNTECCEAVCDCDEFCCEVEWDDACAGPGFNNNGCGAAVLCEELCNPDCNNNGTPDDQDIADSTSDDCDLNGIPDECQDDSDGDGAIDACDGCPADPAKTVPGLCGCGVADTDSDSDATPDCDDGCPDDPEKITPGVCGCGVSDTDSDADDTPDCIDGCPSDPEKIDPGVCGCGDPDADSDGDTTPDCVDGCPSDPAKTDLGICGCGIVDTDSDADGTPDCNDGCPNDPNKSSPGVCGCGTPDADSDADSVADCLDNCPDVANSKQADSNGDGVGDACDTDVVPTTSVWGLFTLALAILATARVRSRRAGLDRA